MALSAAGGLRPGVYAGLGGLGKPGSPTRAKARAYDRFAKRAVNGPRAGGGVASAETVPGKTCRTTRSRPGVKIDNLPAGISSSTNSSGW